MSDPRPTILIQLDTDLQPSVFDSVVAVDSGVDHCFRHGGVRPEVVRDLVYGAIFTRGPAELHRTAIFVGGSDVAAGESVLEAVRTAFFGPFRVSVLFDANGCNTTAAAAVLAAREAVGGSLEGVKAGVLAATGPVGQRVARLLGSQGSVVALSSRKLDRAAALAARLHERNGAVYQSCEMRPDGSLAPELSDSAILIGAGPEGVQLVSAEVWKQLPQLKALIDLNAVPPLGLEGVEAGDRGTERSGKRTWGALGIGGIKMKIHRRAIQELFTANDRFLDAEEILQLGQELGRHEPR